MLSTVSARGGLLAWACAVAGCSTGSVEIVLDVPAKPELAPQNAATVTLVVEELGQTPRATTAVIADDGSFDLGKLPVVDGLALSVVMRSSTQRVVGYGRAMSPVDVQAREVVQVDVPMRRPFAYLTGPTGGLAALDTTLDAAGNQYQQMVSVNGGASLVAAAGGDVWAIAASGHAVRVAGATHQADGATINLPAGVTDAVATSDGRWLVAGTANGLAIADITTGDVTNVAIAGGVDRVAIGARPGADGVRAIGLSGRRTPGACGASSKVAVVDLASPAGAANVQDVQVPLSDIAASETVPELVGADPCNNALVRLTVGGEISTSTKLADVPAPTAAAMLGDHAWAIGSVPGVIDNGGVITTAGHAVLVASAVDGSGVNRADLPPVRQVAHGFDNKGNDLVLSRDMNAATVTPLELVVVPPGDQIALTYGAHYDAPELTDGFGTVIPQMSADTNEYELLSATGGALVQRVLARCNLTYDGTLAAVPVWKCEPAAGADLPIGGQFTPGNLAVLFGGR